MLKERELFSHQKERGIPAPFSVFKKTWGTGMSSLLFFEDLLNTKVRGVQPAQCRGRGYLARVSPPS